MDSSLYHCEISQSMLSKSFLPPGVVQIDINELLRTIIIFGAFFINHIYVDIFLTVKNIDSLILNGVTWGIFFFNAFINPGKID